MNLQDELIKYQYLELTDKQLSKLTGTLSLGSIVSIEWKDREEMDRGYIFSIPGMDEDLDLLDVFVHVPSPDNSDGIGDAPAEWVHLNALLSNDRCIGVRVVRDGLF